MKRIFSVLFAAVVVLCMLSGCSMKNETYSDEEKQVIKAANQIISSEYDVTFDEGDFSYSVGKQIKENEFVSLDSEEKQQEKTLISSMPTALPLPRSLTAAFSRSSTVQRCIPAAMRESL